LGVVSKKLKKLSLVTHWNFSGFPVIAKEVVLILQLIKNTNFFASAVIVQLVDYRETTVIS